MKIGVISAGDIQTAKAGEWILKRGGNAYDALLSSLLAAPLCEPILTSLGGGGFMLSCEQGKKPVVYDFFVDVPSKNRENKEFFPIEVDFGTTTQEFHIGAASIAVPGMIKGIWKIYQDLCSMPMKEIIQPALKYAQNGIYISKIQADFLKLLEPIFTSTSSSRELYTKNGKLIDETHLFKNPKYADFLVKFAKDGENLFYEGGIAEEIEHLCNIHNGLIDKEILTNYKVEKRDPVSFNYRKYRVYTNPPPSSGGILIAFSFLLLNELELDKLSHEKYIEVLVEAQKITSKFRQEHIDNFIHENNLEAVLDNESILSDFKNSFKKKLNLWGNTTHISVVDSFGNGASCTSTNGEGSGYVLESCGIMLNNMLGEEDLNPHGFFSWEGGLRLPSMMAPTALYKDGKFDFLLGSAGSNRIRSAILQTIVNHVDFKMELEKAINSPRVHYEKETVFLEPPLEINDISYDIKNFNEFNLFFGGVQAADSSLNGGADIRRGASTIIVKKD